MAPERGCGRRIAGGTYLVTNTSPNGRPLEHFLFCPPLRVPDVGLSTQGQIVVQIRGEVRAGNSGVRPRRGGLLPQRDGFPGGRPAIRLLLARNTQQRPRS